MTQTISLHDTIEAHAAETVAVAMDPPVITPEQNLVRRAAGLLASVPRAHAGRTLVAIPGSVPDPGKYPSGCRFHPRCQFAEDGRCDTAHPDIGPVAGGRIVRCLRADELSLATEVAR